MSKPIIHEFTEQQAERWRHPKTRMTMPSAPVGSGERLSHFFDGPDVAAMEDRGSYLSR